VAATPSLIASTQPTATEPLLDADSGVIEMTSPKSQPLWRFALVGLGPLTALGVFALLVALFQRLA
jgi:hypothetical protein